MSLVLEVESFVKDNLYGSTAKKYPSIMFPTRTPPHYPGLWFNPLLPPLLCIGMDIAPSLSELGSGARVEICTYRVG